MTWCDVAIIGAGPYGLSAAAHLRTVKGLEVRIFGEPMSFWESNMPAGMLLRSNWTATQIADPDRALTLEAFQVSTGDRVARPVSLHHFIRYGHWYQQAAVPHLEKSKVMRVEGGGTNRFRLVLETGKVVVSRRVVVAAGIGSFARRPIEFQNLSPDLSSHTSEHSDFLRFAGKEVLVIGGGQSALESAALLHEAGAKVEIVTRSRNIHWLQGRLSKTLHFGLGKLTRDLLYAPTDVGPAGLSQLMARPDLLRQLPRALQDRFSVRCVRPAGARWLVQRLHDVPITLGHSVVSAAPGAERVKVKLDDGTERTIDHILLGTGYHVDISKYEFIAPELLRSIHRCNGYPRLQAGLETSVPGLHIVGAPAAWSFGPLMQFVSGTRYASRALMCAIAGNSGVADRD